MSAIAVLPDQKIRKSFAAPTLAVDLKARTVRHWVTTNALDEEGEVLIPQGGDISRFKAGSTVFDVHDYDSKSVVGTCQSYEVSDKGHIATTKFASRPPAELLPEGQTWWPDVLLWLYHTGDIKGWSIGMNGLSARMPTKKDLEDYGSDLRRVWTKYRVLEYSVAPLPCNAEAMTLAGKGIISKSLAERLVSGEQIQLPEPMPAAVISEEILLPIRKVFSPVVDEIVIIPRRIESNFPELVRARLTGKMYLD